MLVVSLSLLLMGCSTWPNGQPYAWAADLKECRLATLPFALIPDFGMTGEGQLKGCMEKHGWIQTHPSQWPHFGVPGYRPQGTTQPPPPIQCRVNGELTTCYGAEDN